MQAGVLPVRLNSCIAAFTAIKLSRKTRSGRNPPCCPQTVRDAVRASGAFHNVAASFLRLVCINVMGRVCALPGPRAGLFDDFALRQQRVRLHEPRWGWAFRMHRIGRRVEDAQGLVQRQRPKGVMEPVRPRCRLRQSLCDGSQPPLGPTRPRLKVAIDPELLEVRRLHFVLHGGRAPLMGKVLAMS